jgi:uncharacterized protein (UPF0261 family)
MASGDVRAYVGAVDVTLMNSVVDIAGVNSVSAQIMSNAAGATGEMVPRPRYREHEALQSDHHRGGAAMSQFVRRRGGLRRV